MAAETRERILEAACDLIAADGIDDVRIARVAMRAGASTALVHHYFSTREELLEQALQHSFESAGDERFRADAETESPTAALARGIATSLPFPGPQEREWVLWVELWLRAVRDPGLRPIAASLYERYTAWMESLLEVGVATGEFRADLEVAATAKLAIALLDGAGIRALISDPQLDVAEARRLVAGRLAAELGVAPEALALDQPDGDT